MKIALIGSVTECNRTQNSNESWPCSLASTHYFKFLICSMWYSFSFWLTVMRHNMHQSYRVCIAARSVFLLVLRVGVRAGAAAPLELCHYLLTLHPSRGIVISDSITLRVFTVIGCWQTGLDPWGWITVITFIRLERVKIDTLSPLLRNNFNKGIQTFLKTRGKEGGGGVCVISFSLKTDEKQVFPREIKKTDRIPSTKV